MCQGCREWLWQGCCRGLQGLVFNQTRDWQDPEAGMEEERHS